MLSLSGQRFFELLIGRRAYSLTTSSRYKAYAQPYNFIIDMNKDQGQPKCLVFAKKCWSRQILIEHTIKTMTDLEFHEVIESFIDILDVSPQRQPADYKRLLQLMQTAIQTRKELSMARGLCALEKKLDQILGRVNAIQKPPSLQQVILWGLLVPVILTSLMMKVATSKENTFESWIDTIIAIAIEIFLYVVFCVRRKIAAGFHKLFARCTELYNYCCPSCSCQCHIWSHIKEYFSRFVRCICCCCCLLYQRYRIKQSRDPHAELEMVSMKGGEWRRIPGRPNEEMPISLSDEIEWMFVNRTHISYLNSRK